MTTFEIKISKFVATFVYVYFPGILIFVISCSADNTQEQNRGVNIMDKLNTFSEKLQVCGRFFHKDEFRKYFQECLAQHSATGQIEKLSSSSESLEDNGKDDQGKREKRFAPFSDQFKESREKLGASIELFNQPTRGQWKMFENPHVFKNPCLISCVLEKFEVINSTGHGDQEKIQGRVEEILAARNKTDFVAKASTIAKKCIDERNTEEEQLKAQDPSLLNQDAMDRAKCRFVIKMGKCITRNVMMECYYDNNDPHSTLSTVGNTE